MRKLMFAVVMIALATMCMPAQDQKQNKFQNNSFDQRVNDGIYYGIVLYQIGAQVRINDRQAQSNERIAGINACRDVVINAQNHPDVAVPSECRSGGDGVSTNTYRSSATGSGYKPPPKNKYWSPTAGGPMF